MDGLVTYVAVLTGVNEAFDIDHGFVLFVG